MSVTDLAFLFCFRCDRRSVLLQRCHKFHPRWEALEEVLQEAIGEGSRAADVEAILPLSIIPVVPTS